MQVLCCQSNGCFECTIWDTFCDSCSSVYDVVDTVTEYMNFCVDTILPKQCVTIYPKEKHWMTKVVNTSVKAKQYAFQTGDRISLKMAQAELKVDTYPVCKLKGCPLT